MALPFITHQNICVRQDKMLIIESLYRKLQKAGVQPSDESGELYSHYYLGWKNKDFCLCVLCNAGDDKS